MSDVELSEPVIECAGCNEMAGNCYMWVEVGGKTYCSSVCAKRNAPEPMPPRPAPALTPKQEAADEMFDALYALTHGGSGHDRGEEWDRAEAALAKAGRP